MIYFVGKKVNLSLSIFQVIFYNIYLKSQTEQSISMYHKGIPIRMSAFHFFSPVSSDKHICYHLDISMLESYFFSTNLLGKFNEVMFPMFFF